MDALLELFNLFVEHFAVVGQGIGVHCKAAQFHRCQHLGQRQLDLFEELELVVLFNLFTQHPMQRFDAGTAVQQSDFCLVHSFGQTGDVAVQMVFLAQPLEGVVGAVGREQISREHHVVLQAGDAAALRQCPVVERFAVVGQLRVWAVEQLEQLHLCSCFLGWHTVQGNSVPKSQSQSTHPMAAVKAGQQADGSFLWQGVQQSGERVSTKAQGRQVGRSGV